MITATQTAAEIVSGSHANARVLERYGIDYCAHSDRTLEEICHEQHIDTQAVIAELDRAPDAPADDQDWTSISLRELMDHLVRDHAFIRSELPLLERRLNLVVETYRDAHPSLAHLPRVFRNLMNELEAHITGEECELFPAIERHLLAMEAGETLRGSPLAAFGGPLQLMEQEHESAGATLRLLREFSQNYNVPKDACPRYRALIDGLTELEDRLVRHMYLENTVLYPRSAALKPAHRRQGAPADSV